MTNPLVGYPRIIDAAKDILTATAGLLVLRGLGMKFEIGQLNMKTFAFGALLSGAAGATGREVANNVLGKRKDQNTNMMKLASLATFAAGALSLSQMDRVTTLLRLPALTQFASRNQMFAVASFAIISMVATRRFDLTNLSMLKPKEVKEELKPIPDDHGKTQGSEDSGGSRRGSRESS